MDQMIPEVGVNVDQSMRIFLVSLNEQLFLEVIEEGKDSIGQLYKPREGATRLSMLTLVTGMEAKVNLFHLIMLTEVPLNRQDLLSMHIVDPS